MRQVTQQTNHPMELVGALATIAHRKNPQFIVTVPDFIVLREKGPRPLMHHFRRLNIGPFKTQDEAFKEAFARGVRSPMVSALASSEHIPFIDPTHLSEVIQKKENRPCQ